MMEHSSKSLPLNELNSLTVQAVVCYGRKNIHIPSYQENYLLFICVLFIDIALQTLIVLFFHRRILKYNNSKLVLQDHTKVSSSIHLLHNLVWGKSLSQLKIIWMNYRLTQYGQYNDLNYSQCVKLTKYWLNKYTFGLQNDTCLVQMMQSNAEKCVTYSHGKND